MDAVLGPAILRDQDGDDLLRSGGYLVVDHQIIVFGYLLIFFPRLLEPAAMTSSLSVFRPRRRRESSSKEGGIMKIKTRRDICSSPWPHPGLRYPKARRRRRSSFSWMTFREVAVIVVDILCMLQQFAVSNHCVQTRPVPQSCS